MPQQWQFLRVNYAADYAAAEDAAVHDAKLLGRELAQLDHTDRHARPVTDAAWGERMAGTAAVENSDDPIISCLSCALLAAERGNDQYCADVLRLAITVRRLRLRSEVRTAVEPVGIEPMRRQVCALQKWRLKRVVEYVDSHLSAKITLSDLAVVAGLSRMYFASQFRMATSLRPHEFLLKRRIGRAEELLQNTTMPIAEIALTVGFQTQAHFTTVFKRFIGCTPHRWRAISQMPTAPEARNRVEATATAADEEWLGPRQPSMGSIV
jgi:AraC family transcriptional regulator